MNINMRIEHIAIWTENLELMKDFYIRYFGCKVSDRYENPSKQFASYFLSFEEGARIEIMTRTGIKCSHEHPIAGLAHFAILVDSRESVDSFISEVQLAGVTITGYPRVTGDGYYESVIQDPDGNQIEIVAK